MTGAPDSAPEQGDQPVPPQARPEACEFDLTAPLPLPARVRLFATDLDGTLLNSALEVGPFAKRAIPRAAAAGVELVFVTGRPPRWLVPVVAATGHAGYAVCANGALIVDLATQRLLKATPVAHELGVEVVGRLREMVPGIRFAIEYMPAGELAAASVDGLSGMTAVGYESDYHSVWAPPGAARADVLELLERGPTIKLLGSPPAVSGHDSDSLLSLVAGEFAGQLHVTHSGARGAIVEIQSGEIDKAVGLADVAARLGVARGDVVAVGDMPNDVPMIRWAGTSYAVANAHPLARAAADHLVAASDDDGVGRLLSAIVAAAGS